MRGKGQLIAGTAAILLGLFIFLWPDISTWNMNRKTQALVAEFEEEREMNSSEDLMREHQKTGEEADKEEEAAKAAEAGQEGEAGKAAEADQSAEGTQELLQKMKEYNSEIYEDGQADFTDAWSVTLPPSDFSDFTDQMFGYITIPAMDLTLALYLGASEEHMAAGAVVLGGTSLPVGGQNTNSVIAAHRGYRGAPYFREIEKLKEGDLVYVTNPWETLCYQVKSIAVIDPEGSDEVKIQPGKEMLTLLTCHPYRSHGKYRYAVYCERCLEISENEEQSLQPEAMEGSTENITCIQAGREKETEEETAEQENACKDMESSERDIRLEQAVRRGAALLIFLMMAAAARKQYRRGKNK